MTKAMIAINSFSGIVIASVFFFTESDRSGLVAFWVVAVLICGVAFPARLSIKAEHLLATLPEPVPQRVRQVVIFPLWAGFVAMNAGLFLAMALSR